jgi:spore coat protein U-like protein
MFFPRLRIVGLAAAVLAIGSLGTLPVQAGQASSSVTVSASVAQNCTISAGSLGFSAYDPVVANATAALQVPSSVALTCTKGATSVTMAIGGSLAGNSCAASTRCLYNGTSQLVYTLYQNNGYSTPWGISNGTTNSVTESNAFGITAPYSVNIYGQIAAAQDVTPGTYADTVTAYVNY